MRPTGTALLVLVLVLMLLAGCSGGDPGGARHPTTTKDDRFIAALVAEKVTTTDAPHSQHAKLVTDGKRWCDRLRDPSTTQADVRKAVRTLRAKTDRTTALKGILVLGTAAKVYCPAAARRLRASGVR
jgi:hypothetical protein